MYLWLREVVPSEMHSVGGTCVGSEFCDSGISFEKGGVVYCLSVGSGKLYHQKFSFGDRTYVGALLEYWLRVVMSLARCSL